MTIPISQAIEIYLEDKRGQRLSWHTLVDYDLWFRRLKQFLPGDPFISEIGPDQLRYFFLSYDQVSKKTLLNAHCALSSLWTWATTERDFCKIHVLHMIKTPRPDKPVVQPFTQIEVKKMIEVLDFSTSYKTKKGKSKPWRLKPKLAARNLGILFFLLDSGLRVTELCGLNGDNVHPGDRGVFLASVSPLYSKYSKGRIVAISARTWEIVQRYLRIRGNINPDDPLFCSDDGGRMTRDLVRQMLERLGIRSGVPGVYAHKFRHTFAINFLRNGGDPFTLQAILGHSTMEMVQRYLALAQTDLERNQAKASPVINWDL